MTNPTFIHELGVFLLGAGSCALVSTYTPLETGPKQVAVSVIALATVAYMARIAGVL